MYSLTFLTDATIRRNLMTFKVISASSSQTEQFRVLTLKKQSGVYTFNVALNSWERALHTKQELLQL